ncbi:MAG: hypothetical protein KF784_00750 [Fimbriimonadaceae bacterium]|nr:hypothetical protein [Fimbriimonadaceae bacterium]
MSRLLSRFAVAVSVAVCLAGHVDAQVSQLTPQERAIAHCLTLIRDCQLPDGAFTMKKDGPVWIQPYFANHAALALVAGKQESDLPRVAKWLEWYAAHQHSNGTVNDFVGSRDDYKDRGTTDATDSTAATFLIVVERYHKATAKLPDSVREAAKNAVAAIESVTDRADGLTWAHANYRVKYLMDNIEVYGGLVSAERLFIALGEDKQTSKSARLRNVLGNRLIGFWQAKEERYAYALLETGAYEVRPADAKQHLGTECMANLFALTWVAKWRGQLWSELRSKFKPDTGLAPQAPAERWFMAASRSGSQETVEDYRQQTISEALTFNADNVYLHRPAVTALALLEGASWLSGLTDRRP